jgi:hypothetical protein
MEWQPRVPAAPDLRAAPDPGGERGQAAIEWTALMGVVALALAVLGAAVAPLAGWRLGESVLHAIACAAGGWCERGDAVERAYGASTAALVRRFAPNVAYERDSAQLPVDFRRCRRTLCSDGPDAAGAIDRSSAGLPVTAFTRVIDGRRSGRPLYLQYWLYFPESFSGGVGRVLGHRWPGYHADDWEGYQVRIGAGGGVQARATAHGGYRSGKRSDGWGPWTGWYRVSGGSHAGHLVSGPGHDRRTEAGALRLIPLERMPDADLHRFAVSPPWDKGAYRDPESPAS